MSTHGFSGRDIRDVARRWMILLGLLAVGAGVTGFELASRTPQEYVSTARLVVGPMSGPMTSDMVRAASMLGATYADVLTTDDNLRSASSEAGIKRGLDLKELERSVQITSNSSSRVLTLAVTRSNAQDARKLALALVRTAQRYASSPAFAIPDRPNALSPMLDIRELHMIDAPRSGEPASRPVLLYAIIAALASVAAALPVLVWWDVRHRHRGSDTLSTLTAHRVLGTCTLDSRFVWRRKFVSARRRATGRARAYQLIAAKSELLAPKRPLRSLAVVGTENSAASAEVAANMALMLAKSGRTVAFIDLTMNEELTNRLLHGNAWRGIEEVGGLVLETGDVAAGDGRVVAVLSHEPSLTSSDLPRGNVIERVQEISDLVVVHAPAVLAEPGTVLIASMVDAVAVVVNDVDTKNSPGTSLDAIEALEHSQAPLLGAIVAVGKPGIADSGRAGRTRDGREAVMDMGLSASPKVTRRREFKA